MNTYLYILTMALTTYLIRALPLTIIRRKFKNKFMRSFLYYVPYVTLAVMTFPAILEATDSAIAGLIAAILGIVAAYFGCNTLIVAVVCCVSVYLLNFIF